MGLKSVNWKRFPRKCPILSTLFLSAAIQLTPQIASQPSEDFLRDNDFPEALSESFNTEAIRVYGRWNPLSTLHFVGRPVGVLVNNYPDEWGDAALETALAPVQMVFAAIMGVLQYVPPYTGADAYAVPNKAGTCYIRPPSKKVDLKYLLSRFSDMKQIRNQEALAVNADVEKIANAFRTMTMAHEMRHCEQPRNVPVENMTESDADLAALRVLLDSGYEKGVVEEAYKLRLAARLIGGRNDAESHDTGMNIMLGHTVALSSFKILAAQRTLTYLVEAGVKANKFPDDMSKDEKHLQMIMRLSRSDVLNQFGSEVDKYASAYIQAYLYLNRVANDSLIEYPGYFSELNINYTSITGGPDGPDFQGFDVRF